MKIQLLNPKSAGEFEYRWPSKTIEHFSRSWHGDLAMHGHFAEFRHALGERHVYGRPRVHSVSWIGSSPFVEGVEADDYLRSKSLLSGLRLPNKQHVRNDADVPDAYKGFRVVQWRHEVHAPYVPDSLAVKIEDEDIAAWATHAAIRAATLGRL